MLFWGSNFVAAVNLTDSAWDEEDAGKRRNSSGGANSVDADSSASKNTNNSNSNAKDRVQRLDGYRDVLAVAVLSDNELVVVERPWKTVLAELKEQPVYKHRYIL